MANDLLIEIGTEELPPKTLETLIQSFKQSLVSQVEQAGLNFDKATSFATPRRLAVIFENLDKSQADRQEQKLGPNVKAALDKEGKPSKAALGFAASCGASFEQLEHIETDKGTRLGFEQTIKGQSVGELMPGFISQALQQLPIAKRMRWGSSRNEFVRPIKWFTLVFAGDVINAQVLDIAASNKTYGHRFHAPEAIEVTAQNYQQALKDAFVIADLNLRKTLIKQQVEQQAAKLNATAVISEDLLTEVTALVEWPVAITGSFDTEFLQVPAEALISSMVEHQKYFHLLDAKGNLLPNFITVSNIQCDDYSIIINGNERVIRPRLSDAVFFFETDKKIRLENRLPALKNIIFQKELGTVFEKSQRVSALAEFIATAINANSQVAKQAGFLAKADLVTEMVSEFPSLQGLMGMHYALNDGEPHAVATAIYEQYLPKSANDSLPETLEGAALSLADRIDTVIGIFGIGQLPTGNKDPFALRRQALAILKTIVEKQLNLDLQSLFEKAFSLYHVNLAENTVAQALDYTLERFKAYYQAKGVSTEVYLAVAANKPTAPLDFDQRIAAVTNFNQLEQAQALASANKRVANILAKQDAGQSLQLNPALLQEPAEIALSQAITQQKEQAQSFNQSDYQPLLQQLAKLKQPVDDFFENVLVMADDPSLKNNRLALLSELRGLFLQVADISLLAKK